MLYPNRTHSISGGLTRTHLFATLTRFVEETLGSAGEVSTSAVVAPAPK
jgi:hypothetical protein